MRAADGDHLPCEVEEELPRERMAADRPDGLTHGGGCPGHGHERDVLLPYRAADIVADLGIDPASPAGLVERLDARGAAPIIFAEHQPFHRTRLRDHTRSANAGPDIGDAADEALVGGVAYVGTSIGRPGVIAQTGSVERLVFGEYDGRRSARVEAFYEACRRGGINAEISDDIRRSIWEKYVSLVAR